MRRLMITLWVAVLGPWFAVQAATTPGGTTYEVEVLVFENRLPELEGGELWTRDTVQPLGPEINDAVTVGTALPESDLTRVAEILENDGHYRILTHKRWLQNTEAKSTTRPMRINSMDGELDGTLRFYLSRFLHVEISLAYSEPGVPTLYTVTPATPGLLYRISEQRRVKRKDVHYFDHPKFGALVRVAPVEP